MKSTSGDSGGRISSVPPRGLSGHGQQLGDARVDERFERGELRRDAVGHRVGVVVREFELVRGVDLGLELDRFDGRPLQAKGLRTLAAAVATHALHLVAARERVGVVLQRDRALHNATARREHDEAALDELG